MTHLQPSAPAARTEHAAAWAVARSAARDGTRRAHAAALCVLNAAVARCRPGVALSAIRAAAAQHAATLGCQPAFVLPASSNGASEAAPDPQPRTGLPGDVLWIGVNDLLLPVDAPDAADNEREEPRGGAAGIDALSSARAHPRGPDVVLRPGDVATLDVALRLGGWAADIAVAIAVEPATNDARALVAAARAVTTAGSRVAQRGGGDAAINAAVVDEAARLGVRIVPGLVGHQVGRSAHAGAAEARGGTWHGLSSQAGAVTVEPIVSSSAAPLPRASGGLLVSNDGAPAACFEDMVWIKFGL